jgi:hypothetical protein
MTTNRQPTEEGFQENDKNEGGQRITLNRATCDRDRWGNKIMRAVQQDAGACTGVDGLNRSDKIRGVTKVTHDAKQFGLVDGVECIREIDVHDVQVTMRTGCVFEGV